MIPYKENNDNKVRLSLSTYCLSAGLSFGNFMRQLVGAYLSKRGKASYKIVVARFTPMHNALSSLDREIRSYAIDKIKNHKY